MNKFYAVFRDHVSLRQVVRPGRSSKTRGYGLPLRAWSARCIRPVVL